MVSIAWTCQSPTRRGFQKCRILSSARRVVREQAADDAKDVPKSRSARVALPEEIITFSDVGNGDGNMLSVDHSTSKPKLRHRKSSLAASSVSFQQSVVTSMRQNSRGVTRNLKQRLKDFDRRYVKSCRNSRRRKKGGGGSDTDPDSSDNEKADGEDEKAQRLDDRQKTDSAFEQALHFMDKSVLKERPLQFKIVQGSSNRGEFPPTELTRERGKWETAPLHVRNEYIIVELRHGPGTITSVSFGLPGNESSVRHGRIYYSTGTIEGPWTEAWKFENRAKENYAMKTSHDYNRLADEFRDLLEKQCGGISDAWNNVLDTNGDGALSYTEFCVACSRLRQLTAVKKAKRGSLFEDHQRLFDSIDVDASGSVRLEDLQKKGGKLPVSSWWKLVFNNNWGSTAHLAVCSPLRIYTTVNETEEGLGLDGDLLPGKPTYDLTRAFDLKALDVSDDQIALRQLAQKHGMPVNTLEEIYSRFCEVDCDSSGVIEKDEFHLLVLKLHGARDVMDVPRSRLKFFWQEADRNGNGEIDFDEFLDWFWSYFSKETASTFKKTHALVETYYSSVAWPRGDTNRRKSMVQQELEANGVNVKEVRKSVLKLVAANNKPSRRGRY